MAGLITVFKDTGRSFFNDEEIPEEIVDNHPNVNMVKINENDICEYYQVDDKVFEEDMKKYLESPK